MTKEQLEKIIFGENTRVYAVLDGASVPDLPTKLFEMRPPRYCLFSGELEPDMAEVAPYLVRLYQGAPFTDWFLGGYWGKHWGIFVHSRKPMIEIRKHFRSLITVYDETGKPMIFRFYDPRVLQIYLPTCEPEEIEMFFGDADYYFAESPDDEKFIRFGNDNGKLQKHEFEIK